MRTRETTRGGFTITGSFLRSTRSDPSQPFSVVSVPTSPFGASYMKQITDVGKLPGFFKICKQGGILPMHTLDVSTIEEVREPGAINKTDVTHRDGHQPFVSKTEVGEWTSDLLDSGLYGYLPEPTFPDAAVKDVLTRAAAKAMEPDWDALTFLAEAGSLQQRIVQILLFLRGLLKRMKLELAANLRRYYTNTEFRNRKRSKRELKRLQDSLSLEGLWLTYRYEVLPLISDFNGALDAFQKKGVENKTRKGKAVVDFPVDESRSEELVRDWSATDVVVQSVRGSITVRSTAIGRSRTLRPAAWGSILTTAWELVSLSFVVDWFIDVGSWLSTIAYSGEVELLAQCASVKTELTFEVWSSRTYSGRDNPTGPNYVSTSGSCTPHVKRLKVVRYLRWPDSPSGLPSWNPRITTPRLLDAAALLAVFTGGSRKRFK